MSVSAELSGVCTMAWILLFFLLHCTGSFSQPMLTQLPSASASLGASAKLTCTLSSEYSTYIIHWYQQETDKAPKYLMYVNKDGNHGRGNGIPDRFSGSSSGANRYLSISNIEQEDEAAYICGADYNIGGQYGYIFGSGTRLSVLGQPKSTPTITLFPPSPDQLQGTRSRRTPEENKATLVCLISNFYPSPLTVTWKADGKPITQGVNTAQPTKEGNKYVASSFLNLTPDEWRLHNSITCQVTHEGDIVEKSVSHTECL